MLQDQLNILFQWGNIWGLTFNERKCSVMSITRSRNPIIFNYQLNNVELERVNKVTDLGLLISESLSWDAHIENIVRKANQRLGLIKRCLGSNPPYETKLIYYTSLVRPILEYGTIVWSVHNKRCLNMIESVQRRATKYITNDYNISYPERLMQCDLLPLSLRREYLDCTFLYACINGLYDFNIYNIIEFYDNEYCRTRYVSPIFTIKMGRINTELYMYYYTKRITNIWNQIPEDIRLTEVSEISRKPTSFKKKINVYFKEKVLNKFNTIDTCTWVSACRCARCRPCFM